MLIRHNDAHILRDAASAAPQDERGKKTSNEKMINYSPTHLSFKTAHPEEACKAVSKDMSGAGYTLIEVSITLAALLIMLTFSINLALRTPQTILTDALRSLQVELICLQQQAISCNMQYHIVFLPNKNAYQIVQTETRQTVQLPKNIIFGFKPGVKGSPGKPNTFITQAIRFESPHPLAAIIQPHGRISSGTVYLMHTNGSEMGALTITPHQIAHIRVYLLERGTWKLLAT